MTRRISALTALAIALSMFVGPAACMRRARVESQQAAAPDYYAPAPATVLFAQATQPEVVRAGVVRALADRGYNAESEQPGQIIARYTRGRVDLRVQIQYQASQATITYLGSEGLRIDAAGRARYYDRWVQQLSSSIQNHVAAMTRRPTTYIVQQQPVQPQVYYVQQPVQQPVQQQVIVAAPPPTVVVQPPQPSGTLVLEGNVNGVQGTVYVTP